MAHVIWEYRNVRQNASALHFHLHKSRLLVREPCSIRVACAALAFSLFLSGGAKLLNAQNSLEQHASKAANWFRLAT
jgi:hypothetical protein